MSAEREFREWIKNSAPGDVKILATPAEWLTKFHHDKRICIFHRSIGRLPYSRTRIYQIEVHRVSELTQRKLDMLRHRPWATNNPRGLI